MPLRTDPTLWFNLPGIVAAWQPVRAPNSLLARYNMAHGGDNRYKATDGTAPSWSGALGWYFNGASNQYLNTGVTATNNQQWSMLVRFSGLVTTAQYKILMGAYNTASPYQGILLSGHWDSTSVMYMNGANVKVSPQITTGGSGILGIAGTQGYRNGVADGSAIGAQAGTFYQIRIGAGGIQTGAVVGNITGYVQAAVLYSRTLSAAEMWAVTRQMAYCNVNPDWSAWDRRRKWAFIAPLDPDATVLAVVGTATAAGIAPTVSSSNDATVTAVAGTATAAGITPTLVTSPTIYANPGRAWAYGETDSTAGIASTVEVDQVGAAAGAGVAPGIEVSSTVVAVAGTATAMGIEPFVYCESMVYAVTGTAIAAGIAPTVETYTEVITVTGTAIAAGIAPTVETYTEVIAIAGTAIAAGIAPTVLVVSLVSAVVGTAIASGVAPTVTAYTPAPGRASGSDAALYGTLGSDALVYATSGSDTDYP